MIGFSQTMNTTTLRNLATAAWLTLASLAPARAEPLPQEKCAEFATEQMTLIAGGVKGDFAKGAEWGKANLKSARLKEIERYIEVTEQLGFRCGFARARLTLPPDDDSRAEAAAAAADKGEAPEAPKDEPKVLPKPKPKAKTKAAEAAPEPAAVPRPKPAPKVQAKPAPKADDAFRPTATEPGKE